MKVFVTGRPGVGKTTVLLRCVRALEAMGMRIGGMFSQEVRRGGIRVGFEIYDPLTKRRGWLSHVNQPKGPRVGRYRVNLRDLEEVGVWSIDNAIKEADCVVIDEIGPMELCSDAFREAVIRAVGAHKPLLGVIHWRMRDPVIETIKARRDVTVYEASLHNRDRLHETIVEKIAEAIRGSGR
ncbi:MAG: NTPase [Candidatus Bathyarchaeia archaeon]